MRQKQRLLIDPGISTLFNHVQNNSPIDMTEAAKNIGVEKQRAKQWVKRLEDENLLSTEFENGKRKLVFSSDNKEVLQNLREETKNNLQEEMNEWGTRLQTAISQIDRLKDVVDEEDYIDYNYMINHLEDIEDIHPGAVQRIVDAEKFLGHGTPEKQFLHQFERKFKLVQKTKDIE